MRRAARLAARRDVSARYAPLSAFARPHARVTEGALHGVALHVHDEIRAEGNQGGVGAESTDAQLCRAVLANAHGAGAVRGEVLRFGGKLPVGAGEEQVVGDEASQRVDICAELCATERCFEYHNFCVLGANEHGLEHGNRVAGAPVTAIPALGPPVAAASVLRCRLEERLLCRELITKFGKPVTVLDQDGLPQRPQMPTSWDWTRNATVSHRGSMRFTPCRTPDSKSQPSRVVPCATPGAEVL